MPAQRAIETKIAALFAERQIEQLIAIAEPTAAKRGAILRALWNVQSAIYRLDEYGESTWSLSTRELEKRWAAVEVQIAALVPARNVAAALLVELAAYRDVEIARRSGAEVTTIGALEFYRLKACDLRLARNLISVLSGYRSSAAANCLWPICEIAGEICDDLADLGEDSCTYNANRAAVALSMHPTQSVISEYEGLLRSLTMPVSSVSGVHDDAEAALVGEAILRHVETASQLLTIVDAGAVGAYLKLPHLGRKRAVVKGDAKVNVGTVEVQRRNVRETTDRGDVEVREEGACDRLVKA